MNTTGDVVLKCMEQAGINQTELARRMGIDRRNLNQMLHRGQDIKVKMFTEMLECMGFDLKLEKVFAIRVNQKLLNVIASSGEPKGRYWGIDSIGAEYKGVVNDGSGTLVQEFSSKHELMEWLTSFE